MKLFRMVLLLALPVAAPGAVTGKGDFPLRSPWLKSTRQLYRSIVPAADATAWQQLWPDWFFQAAAPPASGAMQDPVGRGVIVFER